MSASWSTRRARGVSCLLAAGLFTVPVLLSTGTSPAGAAEQARTTVVAYDSFSKPGGYTLADYGAKWANPYGLGEMQQQDTRGFSGNQLNISAAPFRTAYDYSVFDHLKYLAVSTQAFPVPTRGGVEISSTIRATTPGTQPGRVIQGTYTQSGAPYAQPTLEGQQAGAVMNVINFDTGQLFDWFISGSTAFALIERLPSSVTGNTTDPTSPVYVGRSKMYTQIIREVPVTPGVAHQVSIRFSRVPGTSAVDYLLDGEPVAHVGRVGIPLDVQGVDYTGYAPSLGQGEQVGDQVNRLVIGHGLFSLLDAFPYQHSAAPELDVSIPVANRIFGQGVVASFDDFKVKTTVAK